MEDLYTTVVIRNVDVARCIVLIDILLFAIGLIIAAIFDSVWWRINYSKYEEGFEVIEHYHFGIGFMIAGVLLIQPLLIGLGLGLIWKESDQTNTFAHGSKHFRNSTYIGIAMFIILGVVMLL